MSAMVRTRSSFSRSTVCTTAAKLRMLAAETPCLDFGQDADGADEVLVHRVVVVHVELHHRNDAAEIRDETAEHAGLVHAPQHHFRRVLRRDDVEEELVRLKVITEARPDELD